MQIEKRRILVLKRRTAIILVLLAALVPLSVYLLVNADFRGSSIIKSASSDDVSLAVDNMPADDISSAVDTVPADDDPSAVDIMPADDDPSAVDAMPTDDDPLASGEPIETDDPSVRDEPAVNNDPSASGEPAIITSERKDGPTPNGGDYSEIFYFDDDGNSVDKSAATKVIIRECKNDGTLVKEIFATINN